MAHVTGYRPTNQAPKALAEENSESDQEALDDSEVVLSDLSNYDEDDDDESTVGEDKNTKAQRKNSTNSLKLRAQKKLAGRVACAHNSLRPIIGSRASNTLKSAEHLLKLHIKSKSEVKKLMKAVAKTIAKLGVVIRQKVLTDEQLQLAQVVKQQFRSIALTVISFTRTEYTYNQAFLSKILLDCQSTMRRCINEVLSDKSHKRVDYVFDKLRDPELLDSMFNPQVNADQRQALVNMADNLETMIKPKPKAP